MRRPSLILVAAALAAAGFAGTASAQEVEDPAGTVCANPTGEAECFLLAASGTGTARSWYVAVSVTGDARCTTPPLCPYLAASLTGDARGDLAVAGAGDANGGEVAVSGTETAAADGRTDREAAASGTDEARGCVAVSGTGNATATECDLVVETVPGLEASGCEAVLDATGSDAACVDPGTGDGVDEAGGLVEDRTETLLP